MHIDKVHCEDESLVAAAMRVRGSRKPLEESRQFSDFKFLVMKKMILPIIALALGIGFSAFTKVKQMNSGTVWFQLDPSTGQALNSTSGGSESDTDPFGCAQSGEPCAASLNLNQVVDNHDGTFGIASGVNINTDYQTRDYQPQ